MNSSTLVFGKPSEDEYVLLLTFVEDEKEVIYRHKMSQADLDHLAKQLATAKDQPAGFSEFVMAAPGG